MLPRWIEEAVSGRDNEGGYFPAVEVGHRVDFERVKLTVSLAGGRLPQLVVAGIEARRRQSRDQSDVRECSERD